MIKIAFVGAVEMSWHALDELIKQGVSPAIVVLLHPELARRHSDYADLAPLAEANGIPLLYVNNINEPESMEVLKDLALDYVFIMGWSQILKPELLALPRVSCVGYHFAYLPRNRGRAALPWVILNGENEAGVSLMHLDEGLDSGDLITERRYPVAADERVSTLYQKACTGLRDMMREVAGYLKEGKPLPAVPQDHSRATYLAKRTADDGWIEWNQSAIEIDRLIRAVGKPYPGAFTIYRDQKLIIWEARLRQSFNHTGTVGQILTINEDSVTVQCGSGYIDLLTVQLEGGEEMPARIFFKHVHEKLGVDAYSLWKKLQQVLNFREG